MSENYILLKTKQYCSNQIRFQVEEPHSVKEKSQWVFKELLIITLSANVSLYLPRRWGNKNLVKTKFHGVKTLKTPVKNFYWCKNLKSDRMCSRSSVIRPFSAFEPDSGWFNQAVHYTIEHAACRFLQHYCISNIFITILHHIQSLKLTKKVK